MKKITIGSQETDYRLFKMAYNTETQTRSSTMQISEDVRQKVILFQQTEITEHHIYKRRSTTTLVLRLVLLHR